MTEDVHDERHRLVEQAFERGRFPGMVAATSRDGAVAWRRELGRTGTAYRIASITKTFTAVTVMQLRDAGRIDLDDPIGRHLPETPYAEHAIRRLLAHSSGMTAEPAGPWWERIPGGSWEELVDANKAAPMVFGPGERYHYSNLGYGLLGELVARVHGGPWWGVVSERILRPVGLVHTTYAAPAGAAVGSSRHPHTGELQREPSEDEGAMAPAGQLWSTVDDLARWVDVLACGHPGVLEPQTAVEMRTVQSGDPDLQHRGGYGLGLRLRWTPSGTLLGHTGSLPGFLAGMFVDPLTRVGAVVLTNGTNGLDPEGLCAGLIEAAAPTAPADEPCPDPASPSVDLAGSWYWGNSTLSLVPTSDGFALGREGSWWRFSRVDDDTYRGTTGYLARETLTVRRRPDGSPWYAEAATFLFTRTAYDPTSPIPGRPPEPFS